MISQIIYLRSKEKHVQQKRLLVSIESLPDLAISSEAHFVRHRSLSDLFSIFSNSPTLSEFFPSTFVYNYSQIQRQNPSRIEIETK
jgi:hypothetical protein